MKTAIKKFIGVAMLLCMSLVTLSGCRANKKNNDIKTSDIDSLEVIASLAASYPINGDYVCYSSRHSGWERYVSDYYKFNQKAIASIDSFAMLSPLSATADEYIVIKTSDTAAVNDALEDYLKKRAGDFTGYAPAEAAKLSDSEVLIYGDYVALLINEDSGIADDFKESVKEDFELSADAKALFEQLDEKAGLLGKKAANDNSAPSANGEASRKTLEDGQVLIEEIPGVIEPYDTSYIVEAYKTGNESLLTDARDIAVLKEVEYIMSNEIKDDMTQYEKERAIHDYLVANVDYDENALIYSDWYSEYADQPYGCLVDKRAICLGYASTFKMFMDILDIKCVIVKGNANYDKANHAWNLVKLEDGNWYAVDVTWDDVSPNPAIYYNYYNVDDKTLSDSLHYWEKSEYPSATGGKYSGLEKEHY